MSRNANSRFAVNPTNIDISRSRFTRPSSVKTSFNTGQLIPFYVDEVLPGDTFDVETSMLVRLQTLITPMMDNMYLDTYYFFVPNRLVWDHWKEFCGENTQSAWIPEVEYSIPQVTAPAETGWNVGTLADYFGVPTGVPNLSVNALPFRAYALIVNEWFRDQNLQDPVQLVTGDATVVGVNSDNYITDLEKGGMPFIANKYHDYFTSALPSPQKGPDVGIGLAGDVPVYGTGGQMYAMNPDDGSLNYIRNTGRTNSGYVPTTDAAGDINTPVKNMYFATQDVLDSSSISDSGLAASLSSASAVTINSLRLAFQVQKYYEKQARGGSRYIEILKSMFGVTSPDARLQRPEYLGGRRQPIHINQVVQQSGTGTGSSTPQGNVSAFSVTSAMNNDFTRSFVEHGFVIGLAVVRYDHTYQQGLERMWSRKTKFDYYWPVLANIGEQAVLNKEIYAQGNAQDDEVFGYQEAWADYRYKPNRVSGEMRSHYAQSLDSWHLADDYAQLPQLSPSWIQEDKANVDRVLAVQSSVSNQIFGDFYVRNNTVRPMPLYSIPGLVDHH